MNRRTFLKTSAAVITAGTVSGTSYGLAEAASFGITRPIVAVPNLPPAFEGLRVAFLTDLHHGPHTNLSFITQVVRSTLALNPDLILLGGDYCLRDAIYIEPAFEVLGALSAPLGVFGVLGNHDYAHDEGARITRRSMRRAGIGELINTGQWLQRGNEKLWLAGVDDLWWGKPDAATALGETTVSDAVLMVSHNPDFCEQLRDRRVGIVLSGHTHGGQVRVPGMRNPFIPSKYGDKYAQGLIDAPACRVYVSRGLGATGLPVRYNCPPELTLITLSAPNT
ncbi:MAG: metallophosphoesterase [Fimbriiglobus sp.]|nr:metallophosphoesterase [Fimbriiglobus sp.]